MKSSTHPLGTLIETDVLVIGSGASGCGAALGAREQGLDVVLLDKGKLESSGCIGGGNDHYMAVLNEKGAPFDTADDLVKFYSKPLTGYSPTMIVNGWYNHMYHMLKRLEDRGVQFSKNPDGTYKRTQGFGQPGTWWVHIANGMTIKRVMARIVRDSGVHVLDRIMAMKILTDGGKACGVLGWNVSTGEFVIIRAKTVVSAQGRSSTRGYNNSTHNPYNVWMYPYNTGAGVVLGYDAGAAVTELDTYQRATMEPKGYGCPGMNGINSSGAHEISAIGERFMGKYDPMWENGVRNNQIQGTYQEQLEGNGPPFYMDMRHVDPEVVHELQYILMPGDKATFGDWADCTGTDFQHKLLEVEIGELIFGGRERPVRNHRSRTVLRQHLPVLLRRHVRRLRSRPSGRHEGFRHDRSRQDRRRSRRQGEVQRLCPARQRRGTDLPGTGRGRPQRHDVLHGLPPLHGRHGTRSGKDHLP